MGKLKEWLKKEPNSKGQHVTNGDIIALSITAALIGGALVYSYSWVCF